MYINHRPNLCVHHRIYFLTNKKYIHALRKMVFIGTSSPPSFWLLSSLFLDGSLSGNSISKRISSTGKISLNRSLSFFSTVALLQCLPPFQRVHQTLHSLFKVGCGQREHSLMTLKLWSTIRNKRWPNSAITDLEGMSGFILLLQCVHLYLLE